MPIIPRHRHGKHSDPWNGDDGFLSPAARIEHPPFPPTPTLPQKKERKKAGDPGFLFRSLSKPRSSPRRWVLR